MGKKYVMTDETRKFSINLILHRIQAVRDFGDVKEGDLGGWIEKEDNLSHEGNCWLYDDSWACGNAKVRENANMFNTSGVLNSAIVSGNACVSDNAQVCENATIYDTSKVNDSAIVSGNARVSGDARVCENANVFGNSYISGHAVISKDAVICNTFDYRVVGLLGSRNDYTTFYKNKAGGISVSCGCFVGTLDEFKERVKLVYADGEYTTNVLYYKQYTDAIVYAEMTLLT